MTPLPLILLPGLDGTGDLFAPLLATAPADVHPIAIALPQLDSYGELLEAIRDQIPTSGLFAVLGESFSGPLAVAVAREFADRVVAVILCNSFVSPPLTPLLRFFPWSLLFLIPPPRWVVRHFFVGRDASAALVSSVRAAVAKTPRRVLAARMRAVFTLKLPQPITARVLSLHGAEDAMLPTNSRDLEQLSPQMHHKQIRGPHLLLQASPVEAWSAIREFLHSSPR